MSYATYWLNVYYQHTFEKNGKCFCFISILCLDASRISIQQTIVFDNSNNDKQIYLLYQSQLAAYKGA